MAVASGAHQWASAALNPTQVGALHHPRHRVRPRRRPARASPHRPRAVGRQLEQAHAGRPADEAVASQLEHAQAGRPSPEPWLSPFASGAVRRKWQGPPAAHRRRPAPRRRPSVLSAPWWCGLVDCAVVYPNDEGQVFVPMVRCNVCGQHVHDSLVNHPVCGWYVVGQSQECVLLLHALRCTGLQWKGRAYRRWRDVGGSKGTTSWPNVRTAALPSW